MGLPSMTPFPTPTHRKGPSDRQVSSVLHDEPQTALRPGDASVTLKSPLCAVSVDVPLPVSPTAS